MQLQSVIQQHLSQIVADRRYLHQHPELSHQEVNTAAYIAAQLREMGLSPRTGVGGNGVVAVIEGKAPGKCVALRADFDALPIAEATGLPFSSENEGPVTSSISGYRPTVRHTFGGWSSHSSNDSVGFDKMQQDISCLLYTSALFYYRPESKHSFVQRK